MTLIRNDAIVQGAGMMIRTSSGKVLVGKRTSTCSMPSRWQFPGGCVSESETLQEGVIREVIEEADLHIKANELRYLGHWPGVNEKGNYAAHVFLTDWTNDDIPAVNTEPDKCEGWELKPIAALIALAQQNPTAVMPGMLEALQQVLTTGIRSPGSLITLHTLKVWPEFFDALDQNLKTFEARKDDRGFKVGDVLMLREYRLRLSPGQPSDKRHGEYTERTCWRKITYILHGGVNAPFGVIDGHAILGLGVLIYSNATLYEDVGAPNKLGRDWRLFAEIRATANNQVQVEAV